MEIEAKYAIPSPAVYDALQNLSALGGYRLQPDSTQRLIDHYYDTAARSVLAGGYALRLRETAGRDAWRAALKGLARAQPQPAEAAPIHQREEHEIDVAPGALPEAWPDGPARALALRLAGAQPLQALFALRQTRVRRTVLDGPRQVAQLSLDVVAQAGAPEHLDLEIELLPDGTLADLRALDAALAGFALAPQAVSKFERALAQLPPGPPAAPAARRKPRRPKAPGVRAADSMAEAGRKVLRFHFDRMLAHEPGARAGLDIEAVHDMRVATRRQRAALRLFGPYFKPKAVRRWRAGLREAAAGLGAVRDLDVLLDNARAYQATLAHAAAADLEPLLAAWNREREAARAALLDHLDSRAYRKFKQAYGEFVAAEGAQVRPARGVEPLLVRQALPATLWAHYAQVRAYETAVTPEAPIATLHALRIDGKRLRYALEFFAEVLGPESAEAVRAMVALQDHLGELNDAEVTIARVSAFLKTLRRGQAAPRRAALAYLEAQQARIRRLRRTVAKPWKKVAEKRFREWLARSLKEV